MSVYQSQVYWEAMLDRKDLWQGNFASGKSGRLPIFVHIQIENRQTGYFDNHWACYDEPERLLGFIRYVFLPTAFHQLADPNGPIATPVGSEDDMLLDLTAEQARQARVFLEEVTALWPMDASRMLSRICRLCAGISKVYQHADARMRLVCYPGSGAINHRIKAQYWDEAVFKEDVGLSYAQWDDSCRRFAAAEKASHFFLSFLSNRLFAFG
jgi:hypothetical protein